MFLTERLVGVLTYVAVTILAYWLIAHSGSWRGRKIVLIAYLLAISVMAFFYVPYETADVYRLIEYMNLYASMSGADFIAALKESGIPITLLYYRLIGAMDSPGLLSAITAFIVFLNIFYILYDYAKKHKAGNKAIAISFLTIMSTGIYMQTIGNIRTMLAFSIIARCFYDETVKSKKLYKNILWYLIACLIHPAAIVAVALRIGTYIWSNVHRRNTRTLLMSVASLPVIGYFLLSLGGLRFFENIADKAEDYINVVSYSYIWDNAITFLTIAIILISYKMYRHYSKEKNILDRVIEFSWILSIFALIFFFEHATFVRFTQLNLIIMLPVIIYNISMLFNSSPERLTRMLYRLYGFAIVMIFVISASRGALSSLKFFLIT